MWNVETVNLDNKRVTLHGVLVAFFKKHYGTWQIELAPITKELLPDVKFKIMQLFEEHCHVSRT